MFCRKCGKEIKEGVKFCPYCGAETTKIKTEPRQEKTIKMKEKKGGEKEESKEDTQFCGENCEKIEKKKNIRRWIMPAVAAAGVIVLAGAFAMYKTGTNSNGTAKIIHKKGEEKKSLEKTQKKKTDQEKAEKMSGEKAETYPKDITLDNEVQGKIIDLLNLLCILDASGSGDHFSGDREINNEFAVSFLIRSVYHQVPFVDGHPAELEEISWVIPEESVKSYLKNSLDIEEVSDELITVSDGMYKIQATTPTSCYTTDTPQIEKVVQISKEDIQVSGTINYTSNLDNSRAYTVAFEVTLTANTESMWGGYTLKQINRWENKKWEEKEELEQLVKLLALIDFKNAKDITTLSKGELGGQFLYYSLRYNDEFLKGRLINKGSDLSAWILRRKEIEEYLQNSLGTVECEIPNLEEMGNETVKIYMGDPPYVRQVKELSIDHMTSISETEEQISGRIIYKILDQNKEATVQYTITITSNSESIWDSYTLKSIDEWTVGEWETAQDTSEGQKNPLNFQVSASSVLQEEGYDHSTTALSDMDPSTCWIEGVEGTGVGEDLLFTSGEKQSARGLAILPGYLSSEDIYNKNGIPLEIKIQAGDRVWTRRLEEYHPDFAAPMNSIIYIDFGQSISVDWCRVTITDSRSGTKYDDICIAEMFLYGE